MEVTVMVIFLSYESSPVAVYACTTTVLGCATTDLAIIPEVEKLVGVS